MTDKCRARDFSVKNQVPVAMDQFALAATLEADLYVAVSTHGVAGGESSRPDSGGGSAA
jgi:hypothetical protein